jgi:hypothetical protein
MMAEAKRSRWPLLAKVLGALVAVAVVLAIVIAMQPSEFRVERRASVAAPAPVVFAQVNDFHKWPAWSPWAKIDPAMKQTYEGAPSGAGAVYTWAGNHEVGEGRMTITESRPGDLVRIRLEFFKPFAGVSTAEFTFTPEGQQTLVTWSMTGRTTFVTKAVHLFLNVDKMIGDNFESGLARMKSLAEAEAKS